MFLELLISVLAVCGCALLGALLGFGGVSGFLNRCKMPPLFIKDVVNFVLSEKGKKK